MNRDNYITIAICGIIAFLFYLFSQNPMLIVEHYDLTAWIFFQNIGLTLLLVFNLALIGLLIRRLKISPKIEEKISSKPEEKKKKKRRQRKKKEEAYPIE